MFGVAAVVATIGGIVNAYIDKEPAVIRAYAIPHVKEHFAKIGYSQTDEQIAAFVDGNIGALVAEQKFRASQLVGLASK